MASSHSVSRRALLFGLGAFTLGQWAVGGRPATALSRSSAYRADISMLWGALRYALTGSVVEELDPGSEGYRVLITGTGTGVSTRVEARGLITTRYRPLEMKSSHTLAGRESWLSITYDYDRGFVDYHSVGYTLLLGRRRQVDDRIRLPARRAVDDAVSAALNLSGGRLERDAAGIYQLAVLCRTHPADEGPDDDVTPDAYRLEVVPVQLRLEPDPTTGKLVTQMDVSGWSSWTRPDRPARLVFGPDLRLESIEFRLRFGSTARMRFT